MRDYLHVLDLARGHLLALDALAPESKVFDNATSDARYKAYNLGKGKGLSVLQIIEAMRKATGFDFKYEIVGRRCEFCLLALAERELTIMTQARRRAGPHCRPDACREGARVQGEGGPRRNVPRPLELADEEPQGL